MKRPAVMLTVAFLAVAACGGPVSEGAKALGGTEGNLDEIRSGNLELTLLASPSRAATGRGVGFTVEGPFAVAEHKGDLPKADLEYTRITGAKRRTTRFISTASKGFVELDGRTYALRADQLEPLRATGDGKAGGGGLEGLDFTDWIEKPTVEPGPTLDGVATQRITGEVDPVGALNDVLGLAADFGNGGEMPKAVDDDDQDEVRRAVRSTKLELLTGKNDRLLRRFSLDILMDVGQQATLRKALGDLAGVRLSIDLAVTKVNRPVTVRSPRSARPASEQPGARGT